MFGAVATFGAVSVVLVWGHCGTQIGAKLQPIMMSGDDAKRLLEILDTGDIELYFHDGRSVRVHGAKLKLAFFGGVLHNLMEDILEEQIARCKMTEGETRPPNLKVSIYSTLNPYYR